MSETQADPGPAIAEEVETGALMYRRYIQTASRHYACMEDAERLQKDRGDLARGAEESRERLIRLVLQETGTPLPNEDTWYYDNGPIATLRVGNRLVILTSLKQEDCPTTPKELALRCTVVVVDLVELAEEPACQRVAS